MHKKKLSNQMKQKIKIHKSKLLPLVKRFGLFMGFRQWRSCRKRGCHWQLIDPYPPDEQRDFEDGSHLSTGIVKLRCKHCESVRLIRLYVASKDGQAVVRTETGEQVTFSDND